MRMRTLQNLKELGKPADVWEYFAKICQIPRSTAREDQIREFIKEEAEKFGYQTKIDEIKNIAVIIPSTNNSLDNLTKIIIQSHMDMVCIKDDDVEHDFSKDRGDIRWLGSRSRAPGISEARGGTRQNQSCTGFHAGPGDQVPIPPQADTQRSAEG